MYINKLNILGFFYHILLLSVSVIFILLSVSIMKLKCEIFVRTKKNKNIKKYFFDHLILLLNL